jgi:DNA-binding LacI/PurR family transcriptional regulator
MVELDRIALGDLVRLIDEGTLASQHVELPTRLIVRGSTAPSRRSEERR